MCVGDAWEARLAVMGALGALWHWAARFGDNEISMRVSGSKTNTKRTTRGTTFNLAVEFHRETDGRWIADIPALSGVTVYGATRKEALTAVEALALRVIADRLEHGEAVPGEIKVSFAA